MVKKPCPFCDGDLEGLPAQDMPLIPATDDQDFIWQCRGTCKLLVFSCPLGQIDQRLEQIRKEVENG